MRYVLDHVVQQPAARNRPVEDFADLSIVRELEAEGLYRQLWGESPPP